MRSDDAMARVQDGLRLLESGNGAGAEAAFRQAIRLDDQCAEAHLQLGWVLLRGDGHLAAGASFQRAIGLEPDLASAHEGLGVVLARAGRPEAAEIEYREAVRLAPDSSMAHCRLGEALAAQGSHLDAEFAFRDAIRVDPDLAAAHTGLGWTLRQLDARAEAEYEFRTGIALDAGGAEGHLGLGALRQDARQDPAAEAEFREAIRLAPSSAAAHRALGRLLASTGRHAEAEAEFRAVIRLQPAGDTGAQEDLVALEREIGDLTRRWGYWAAVFRQRVGPRRHRERSRPPTRAGVRRRTGRGTWPPAGPDGRVRRRRGPASPKVLLRSPRARPLRRFLAGLIDIAYACTYTSLAALLVASQSPPWAAVLAIGVFLFALNGYLEGRTGQSVGKMWCGLHTIDRTTGERIGGGKGALCQLLHALDSLLVVGYLVGLATGRTFADRIMGTEVVWNPRWVTTTSAPKIAALERKDYKILKRRIRRFLLAYLLLTVLMLDAADPDRPGRHSPWIIRRLWRLLFGSRRPRPDYEEQDYEEQDYEEEEEDEYAQDEYGD